MDKKMKFRMTETDLQMQKPLTIINEPNRFVIKKIDREEVYEIKKSKNFTIMNKMKDTSYEKIKKESTPSLEAYGILGVFSSMSTQYLIVISEANFIGDILKSKIYQITNLLYLPFENLSFALRQQDQKSLRMYDDFIEKNKLFFSDCYDLTNNFHDNVFKTLSPKGGNFKQFLKQHFCWNFTHINSLKVNSNSNAKNGRDRENTENDSESSLRLLLETEEFSITPPVINGYIEIKKIEEYEKEFVFILVARKDCRRTGMRFLCRGADDEGNCANFVETEQIILIYDKSHTYVGESDYQVISHLQVRGSVPVKWTQPGNFKFVPKINLSENFEEDLNIMKKHVTDLNKNYGSAIMINLVDQKGDQLELGTLFNNIYNKIAYDFPEENKPDFIWFDFHHNCKNMKYENLNVLISSPIFKKFLTDKQYYHLSIPSFYNNMKKFSKKNLNEKKIKILSTQKGVFRTNCIDCLDRTNIVQTLISRHFTHQIMIKLSICSKKSYTGKVFDKFRKNFELHFNHLWSNHGDVIANSYAGTGAQKADFTRTGKRTYFGAFKDLLISSKRFFVNNVNDFYYQECQDLFLGKKGANDIKYVRKPSDKIFYSLTILTVSYFVYWLSKIVQKMK